MDSIKLNETKIYDVAEGRHTVQAKTDWCCSSPYTFTVSESAAATYNLTSFKGSKLIYAIGLIAAAFLFYMHEDPSMNVY